MFSFQTNVAKNEQRVEEVGGLQGVEAQAVVAEKKPQEPFADMIKFESREQLKETEAKDSTTASFRFLSQAGIDPRFVLKLP